MDLTEISFKYSIALKHIKAKLAYSHVIYVTQSEGYF